MAWTDMTQLTNCYAWYKSESLSSAYGNGDSISSWVDSSGNGRDISQATSANQPIAVANAVNGYMAADFDGSNDFLSSGSYTQSGLVAASIVVSFDSYAAYNGLLAVNGSSSPSWGGNPTYLNFLNTSNGDFATQYFSSTYFQTQVRNISTLVLPTSTYVILTLASNDQNTIHRMNGINLASGLVQAGSSFVSYPASSTAYIHVGKSGLSNGLLNGQIAEIVIYDAVDEDCADSTWVEGYLADKYSIALPNGHLFKNEPPANAPTTYNPTGGGNVIVIED